MSGQPEVPPQAELDRCLIIAATVGNKWLLYTVIRDVLTRRRPPTLREGIFLVLVLCASPCLSKLGTIQSWEYKC